MMLILVLIGIAAAMWLIAAPGTRFLPQFGRLLTEPRIERGPFTFVSGRSYASGYSQGREVMVRLQLKRTRYGQGYLVVALRLVASAALGEAGETANIESRIDAAAGLRALSVLASHNVLLSVDQGWLKALWQPQGFMIFPGHFVADKWQQVLESLATVARSLEGAS